MNCKNCKRCGCSFAGKNHEMSFECNTYIGKSNADRIRSMTDEELCGFLQSVVQSSSLPIAFIMGSDQNVLVENWFDWLRQEVTEDAEED